MLNKIKSTISQFQKNGHLREIVLGVALAFGIKIFAVATTFLFNMAIARKLGDDLTGQYFLIFSVVSLGIVFGKHGIDRAILRFIAPEASSNNWSKVQAIFLQGSKNVLFYAFISTLFILIFADLIATYFLKRPELAFSLRLLSFAIIPLSFSFCLAEGFKAIKSVAISVSIRGIAIPLLTIVGILLLADQYQVNGIVISQITAGLFVTLIAYLFFIWKIKKKRNGKDKVTFKQTELTDSSQPLFWESVLQEIIISAPIFIIGYFLTNGDVGKYEIARRIALSTNLFLFAFNTILSPKIGEFYLNKEIKMMGRVLRKSVLLMAGLTLPIFAILFFFPDFILSLIGKSFVAGGSVALKIILIGQFIHIMFGPTGSILLMCGYEKHLKISGYIGIVLIVILNLILVPTMGLVGGAIAFSLTLILRNIYIAYWVKRHLNLITIPYVEKILTKLNIISS